MLERTDLLHFFVKFVQFYYIKQLLFVSICVFYKDISFNLFKTTYIFCLKKAFCFFTLAKSLHL